MNTNELYDVWKQAVADNTELSTDLDGLNESEIFDRFYRELDFGTAGLRGVLGAGTNRMNIYTVARASAGVAEYICEAAEGKACVAIAYDSRKNSDLFSKTAAAVFAGYGIKVYIYPYLMPTPALSYAVRNLNCFAGVVVTASHNPAKYNGYKVYGADGCQITEEVAGKILNKIGNIPYFETIPDFEILMSEGKIEYIGQEIIDGFINDAVKCAKVGENVERTLKLVYTPLNGAGCSCVPHALEKCGFNDVTIVPEQKEPNGNFPTCPYPNPEIKEALSLGLELLKKNNADLLLATDPDADRVGTAVLENGEYRLISGNEMGIMLLDYICRRKIESGTMPKNPMAVKTIVTSDMTVAVAEKYGVRLVDVLTGFKYIGEQIAILEEQNAVENYLLGFEESYGYLCSPFVRDKDAVSTSVLICEMANYYKALGKTLGDRMNELYAEFGCYKNCVDSFAFEGSEGMDKMRSIMESLRQNPPKEIMGCKLLLVNDYLKSESLDINGKKGILTLPKSNVLKFAFTDGLGIIVRPSGTEPKLKVYYTVKSDSDEAANRIIKKLTGKDGEFATNFINK